MSSLSLSRVAFLGALLTGGLGFLYATQFAESFSTKTQAFLASQNQQTERVYRNIGKATKAMFDPSLRPKRR